MSQQPSYSLAHAARLKQLQDSISSEKDRSDEEKENAHFGAVRISQDEIRSHGDSQQLGYKKG